VSTRRYEWIGALLAEDLDRLEALLEDEPTLVDSLHPELDDPYRSRRFPVATLLYAAAGPPAQQLTWRSIERPINRVLVHFLLQHGADPDIDSTHGRPLCWVRRRDVMEQLLSAGADINVWHSNGGSPLWFAVWQVDPERLRALLDLGADPRRRDPRTGETALHLAVGEACRTQGAEPLEVVRLLVSAGADPNAITWRGVRSDFWLSPELNGDAPLHFAARYASQTSAERAAEIVNTLRHSGSDPALLNGHGLTAAYVAREHGCPLKVVKLFE